MKRILLGPGVAVLAVAILAGACTASTPGREPSSMPNVPPASEAPQPTLKGTSWRLTYVDGRAWPVGELRDATLRFRGERLGGFNRCNEYGAHWRLSGNELAVGRFVSTLIGCSGDAAWVEDRFLRILAASPVVAFTSDELRLVDPRGVLVFRPA
ncbi:MAG TPA: META domain-containing protein [Actinomycetota bacterium]|nr:META domain-containing protein [Actinomycetota bacterium]